MPGWKSKPQSYRTPPYDLQLDSGKVALFAQNGLSVFSNLKLLLYSDARFEHIVDQTHPIGFEKFTENIFSSQNTKDPNWRCWKFHDRWAATVTISDHSLLTSDEA